MRERTLFLFILFTTALFVSACSDDESRIYTGVSDHWEVNYWRDENLSIKYIGEEPMPKGEINFVIEEGLQTSSINASLNEEGVLTTRMSFNERQVDSDIKVTISWDGESEEIILDRQ